MGAHGLMDESAPCHGLLGFGRIASPSNMISVFATRFIWLTYTSKIYDACRARSRSAAWGGRLLIRSYSMRPSQERHCSENVLEFVNRLLCVLLKIGEDVLNS